MGLAMPSLANITWERLQRESSVTYPCYAPDKPAIHRFGEGFPTRADGPKFVPAAIINPAEEPIRLSMVLTTGRPAEHWHTVR